MKQFLTTFLVIGMLFPAMTGFGRQQTDGLYLSLSDYLGHHLYGSGSIKLHTRKAYLSVQSDAATQHVSRDSVFAVALTAGKTFRLIGHDYYEILNRNAQLLLYKRKVMSSGKAFPADTFRYYFSAGDGPVHELTSWNLKQAFPERASWADKLDTNFHQESDLIAYDSYHHMYKLEWLLQ
ncbi:hypothetical protein [Chitinophaga arvensicola]|uniref:Uncharacterized protein n=1 Tax=Chitinophaga arvensicola TaxID=29529 RepID=A0A1I0R4C3_9BACT|nr:hypothetical protein [Chitinophaga arvensicola]SEW35350.1 hypothetical protein SAMN04488122_2225 [Chitinophaga arvensicola]